MPWEPKDWKYLVLPLTIATWYGLEYISSPALTQEEASSRCVSSLLISIPALSDSERFRIIPHGHKISLSREYRFDLFVWDSVKSKTIGKADCEFLFHPVRQTTIGFKHAVIVSENIRKNLPQ